MPARLEHLARRYIPGRGPVNIDRLGSGLVNQSYRVSREGRFFSMRLTAPRAGELGLDREWECRVLRRAAAAGLAPAVERCEPRAGILVSHWAEGSAWSVEQAAAPENLETVALLARRVHALALLEQPRIVSAAQWIAFYRRSFERPRAALDEAAKFLVDALSEEPPPAVTLCHSDLHVQNLIISPQGAPLILDWEYAHVSDPLWDLAGWACNGDLAQGRRDLLLRLYLEREPTCAEALRLDRLAWLYDYVCLLWSDLFLSSRSNPKAASDAISMRAERIAERLADRLSATGRAGQVPAH
ncbi:MAG: phosphotransferase [Steroidobacteraceae bacterium]|jgi:thiamine kinase